MQTIHIIVLIGGVWLLLGLFFWSLFHGSKGDQVELDEPGSSAASIDEATEYPGRDDWKHASVKVPHADSSAATFHRHVQD